MSLFGVILVCIQSECGKIRTRITPHKDTFHAVQDFWWQDKFLQIREKIVSSSKYDINVCFFFRNNSISNTHKFSKCPNPGTEFHNKGIPNSLNIFGREKWKILCRSAFTIYSIFTLQKTPNSGNTCYGLIASWKWSPNI